MAAMNKRKRESQDIVGGGGRPAPGAAAAAAAANQMNQDFEQHYLQTDDDVGMGNPDAAGMDFAAAFAQHGSADGTAAQPPANQLHVQSGGGDGASASDTAAAAMAQYHTMTVPQSTEQSFLTTPTDYDIKAGSAGEQSSSSGQQRSSNLGDFDVSGVRSSPNGNTSPTAGPSTGNLHGTPKPAVGSEEWHKVRKDNHKEVERRRRETINEGINELAKIVPGCEKNKGSILQRAVQFITQLKDNETQNIEKWTLEKLLTEQAIAELSTSCDKLKAECQRAWTECEQWKKAAQKAGVSIDGEDKGDADGDDAE